MPKIEFYRLYKDYVCGCALRASLELFALLPIELNIVNCFYKILNPKNGQIEDQPILSLALTRKTFEHLDFESLPLFEIMNHIVYRMKFLKTKGFVATEKIKIRELLDR